MNTRLALIVPLLALGIHGGLAADQDRPNPGASPTSTPPSANPNLARVRFVPGSAPMKGDSSYDGAAVTVLDQGPEKGVLWLQANAGIGDSFPVQTQDGVIHFNVVLTTGDDDHLVLEIRAKEGSQKLDLLRDKTGSLEVAGVKYEFLYPSVSVAAAGHQNPTRNKAMIMVKRRL